MAVEQTEAKIAEKVEIGALPIEAAADREIEALVAKGRAELIARKRWRRRVPILQRKRDALLSKIAALTQDAEAMNQSIQAIKDGKGLAAGPGPLPGRPGGSMSPERRAKISAGRRRALARKKREAKEQ